MNKDLWNTCNTDHRATYTDSEIELILSHTPTPENCIALGRALGRSKLAIRQIFQMAYMSKDEAKNIEETTGKERRVSKYYYQTRKAAKKLKLIKGSNIFKYKRANPKSVI